MSTVNGQQYKFYWSGPIPLPEIAWWLKDLILKYFVPHPQENSYC